MERPLSFRVPVKLLESLRKEHKEFCRKAGFKLPFKLFLTFKIKKPLNPQSLSNILPKLEGEKRAYIFYIPENIFENLKTEVSLLQSQTGFPFSVSSLVNYKLTIPLSTEELPQLLK